jgi:translation initiation factor 1
VVQRYRAVYDTASGRLDRCSFCKRKQAACVCPNRQAPGAAAAERLVRVSRQTKGRRGKTVTVISGLPGGPSALAEIAAQLKRECGSGGTVSEANLELQGDHRERVAARLTELGYTVKLAGG